MSVDDAEPVVLVRRQWNDWQMATYRLQDISRLHWDTESGGVGARAPRAFVHGYVWCTGMIKGELAHSCRHGPPPHHIKVCITKKGKECVWERILAAAGPRPPRPLSGEASHD